MKIYHIADVHLSEHALEEKIFAFKEHLNHAVKNQCEFFCIAGDLFDKGLYLHETANTTAFSLINEYTDRLKFIILQGTESHDRPGCLKPLRELKNVYILDPEITVKHFDNISFFGISGNQKESLKEITSTLQKSLSKNINILLFHGEVLGAKLDNGQTIQPDNTTNIEMFDKFDVVMLGHIHAHQMFRSNETAGYCGSICKFIFGHKYDVGGILWEIAGDKITHKFNKSSQKREFIAIDGNNLDIEGEIDNLASKIKDNHIKITIKLPEENSLDVSKNCRKKLVELGAYSIRISAVKDRIQTSRYSEIEDRASKSYKDFIEYGYDLIAKSNELNFTKKDLSKKIDILENKGFI